MDVAKYIGLFLLKNNKCYVHGLGTFEIKRKASKYDGESLHASNHEIILTTSGNVDESLANFIATNEQISISKATRSLKDFSEHVKATVKEGGEVAIPSLGKIAEENDKLYFITAPQLSFLAPSIKAPKSAPSINSNTPIAASAPQPQQEQAPPQEAYTPTYEDLDEGGRKLNWTRIIITLLVLALLAVATYYVWNNYLNKNNNNATVAPPELPQNIAADTTTATQDIVADTTGVDSNAMAPIADTTATSTSDEVAMPNNSKVVKMRVVLNTYDTKDRAHKRFRQLTSYGNKVEIIEEDTNYFHVAMPITAPASDTAYILDSLSKYFNPDGVFIY